MLQGDDFFRELLNALPAAVYATDASGSALANVNALFVQSRWTGADLHSLVAQELSPYCQDGEARAQFAGPKVILKPQVAPCMAIALHELATNAVKYGALSGPNGRLRVGWSLDFAGDLVIRWDETGGPPVKPPARTGFGTRVMHDMIQQQKGEIRFSWQADGLACEIALPI